MPDQYSREDALSLDLTYIVNGPGGADPFVSREELEALAPAVVSEHRRLSKGEGDCRDGETPMLGWLRVPESIGEEYLGRISDAAAQLAGQIDAYVSLGIGGSYLGIEATVKALTPTCFNQLSRRQRGGAPEIYFLGQNVDPDFYVDTMQVLQGKRLGVNVISKSGTTTETAIAFRLIRAHLEQTVGKKAAGELIVATTDAQKGALRKLAEQKGYRMFVVPDDIGGRFSVLSDVGLFGLAVAGIDIREFSAGFRDMKIRTDTDDFWSNPAMLHAAVRYLAWRKGKKIEVVATNSSHLYQLTRWMEQLFPESEGHRGHGMWVSPSMYSEKLHANGQMVQDGERNILETFLRLGQHREQVSIPGDEDDLDGLNYLSDAGRTMNDVNQLVIDGPAFAHFQGGVPNMTVTIPRRTAYSVGQLYFLMERSVAISGYLMGHNPFIQPGVEAYKKAMFALAGKPGSESFAETMRGATEKMTRLVV
jgi:glucose-6-phosphate isomerase